MTLGYDGLLRSMSNALRGKARLLTRYAEMLDRIAELAPVPPMLVELEMEFVPDAHAVERAKTLLRAQDIRWDVVARVLCVHPETARHRLLVAWHCPLLLHTSDWTCWIYDDKGYEIFDCGDAAWPSKLERVRAARSVPDEIENESS